MGVETKNVRLDLSRGSGPKKLAKLLAEGWVIASEQKRGLLSTWPGQTDLILTRQKD